MGCLIIVTRRDYLTILKTQADDQMSGQRENRKQRSLSLFGFVEFIQRKIR